MLYDHKITLNLKGKFYKTTIGQEAIGPNNEHTENEDVEMDKWKYNKIRLRNEYIYGSSSGGFSYG